MKAVPKLILFLPVLLILLGFALFLPGHPQCNPEDLLLKGDMIPVEWNKLWEIIPPALPKDGAQSAQKVVYENGNEIAQHTIYQYKNGLLALVFLRINNEVYFPSGIRVWSDLEGSDQWLLHGDEAKIRCGESDNSLLGYKCDAVIRYGPYISEFSSPIEEGVMSQEEFKAIVIAIDNKIASCIQSPNHQR